MLKARRTHPGVVHRDNASAEDQCRKKPAHKRKGVTGHCNIDGTGRCKNGDAKRSGGEPELIAHGHGHFHRQHTDEVH
ncbi:hypothetical protein D3C71_1547620 [compost metagenome]